jgi:hypothetical protein
VDLVVGDLEGAEGDGRLGVTPTIVTPRSVREGIS